jgi:DNA-binding GntR family transcriptional regulator
MGTKQSLNQQAYERIRLEIITFGLKPGDRITESQLAERFDLGIAAVRAALPRLVQEGLLLNRRRLGHQVAPITVKDIKNVFQLRRMLEPASAELAAGRADVTLLRALDAESGVHVAPGDREAEVAALFANRAFHLAIAEASGNTQLTGWIGQLHDLSIRIQYLLKHEERLEEEWRHSHEAIIEALERGDGAAARRHVDAHLEQGERLVMRALLDLPEIQQLSIAALPSGD